MITYGMEKKKRKGQMSITGSINSIYYYWEKKIGTYFLCSYDTE